MGLNRNARANRNPYKSSYVDTVTVTVGAEATNVINVTIQLKDAAGNNLGGSTGQAGSVFAYLSDGASGQSIAASAPSGGWAIATNGLLIPVVANKAAHLVSTNAGVITVAITESTAKTFYLVIVLPDGSLSITAVTFA